MKQTDVIIILGQGVNADGSVPAHVQHEIQYAIQLCHEQHIPAIMFSGKYSGFIKHPNAVTEAQAMYDYAQSLDPKNILLLIEEESEDTIGNIVFSKVLVDEHNWKNLLIISHPQHLVRVQFIAKRVFDDAYQVTYQGHQKITTAKWFRHTRYFNALALVYTRWLLRHSWPESNTQMIAWISKHHFLYNGSWLKSCLTYIFKAL